MERWSGKVAVVTGASAGIGLYTCKALVRHNMIVVGLARRKAAMEERMRDTTGPGKFYAIECDVTKEESVKKAFEFIGKKFGLVKCLVNNAGLASGGPIINIDTAKLVNMLHVNIMGSLHCVREAVKMMKQGGGEGDIINIGSQLGHKVPYIEGFDLNIYPATKFALRALSETLQNELRDTQIRVCYLGPGVVKTEFFDVAGADQSFLEVFAALDSEDIANGVVYVLSTRACVQIAELTIRHLHDYFR